MWEIEIEFEKDEMMTIRGEGNEISLLEAIRYYDMFVETGGIAYYRNNNEIISLPDKILYLLDKEKEYQKKSLQGVC